MTDDEENLKKEIDQHFSDLWKDAPRIEDKGEFAQSLATNIRDIYKNRHDTQSAMLFLGKVEMIDEQGDYFKGAVQIHLMAVLKELPSDLLKDYKPKLDEQSFITLTLWGETSLLVMIAFKGGHTCTVLLDHDSDEGAVSEIEETNKMLRRHPDAHGAEIAQCYEELERIAK